jgi:hypothetical protein
LTNTIPTCEETEQTCNTNCQSNNDPELCAMLCALEEYECQNNSESCTDNCNGNESCELTCLLEDLFEDED